MRRPRRGRCIRKMDHRSGCRAGLLAFGGRYNRAEVLPDHRVGWGNTRARCGEQLGLRGPALRDPRPPTAASSTPSSCGPAMMHAISLATRYFARRSRSAPGNGRVALSNGPADRPSRPSCGAEDGAGRDGMGAPSTRKNPQRRAENVAPAPPRAWRTLASRLSIVSYGCIVNGACSRPTARPKRQSAATISLVSPGDESRRVASPGTGRRPCPRAVVGTLLRAGTNCCARPAFQAAFSSAGPAPGIAPGGGRLDAPRRLPLSPRLLRGRAWPPGP
jgi:hypothetical protein